MEEEEKRRGEEEWRRGSRGRAGGNVGEVRREKGGQKGESGWGWDQMKEWRRRRNRKEETFTLPPPLLLWSTGQEPDHQGLPLATRESDQQGLPPSLYSHSEETYSWRCIISAPKDSCVHRPECMGFSFANQCCYTVLDQDNVQCASSMKGGVWGS